MLFTDRDIVTLADLDSFEPGIDRVVDNEKLPVTGDNNLIRRAISGAINEVLAAMTAYESYPGQGDLGSNHLAAVMSIYGTRNVPRIHMQQVVVNATVPGTWSAVKTWVAHLAAAEIYRAAWNRKLKEDKYSEKAEQFQALARESFGVLRTQGLPIAWNPLAAPAAALAASSGTWTTANLASVSGTAEAGGTFKVQVTYIDSKSYQHPGHKGNAESHPSVEAEIIVPATELLQVDISTLVPPTGFDFDQGFGQGVTFPRAATGWNLYVNGVLQNAVPIPVETKVYTLTADPVAVGYRVGQGQYPDIWTVMPTGVPLFRA